MLDVETTIEAHWALIHEMSPVISDDGVGNTISAHDVFPHKTLHLLCRDDRHRLSFDPPGEVVVAH